MTAARLASLHRVFPLALLSAALAVGACHGGGDEATDAGGDDGGISDPDADLGSCEGDPRADVYAPGLEKTGKMGLVETRLVDAMPAPPHKKNNTWLLQVLDAKGEAVEGATMTFKLHMPDHGHDGTVIPTVEPMGSDGRYTLKNVYLFMGGIWEITIKVTLPDMTTDEVLYTFCVPS